MTGDEFLEHTKNEIMKGHKISLWVKSHLTILLIWIMIGTCFGLVVSRQLYKQRMDEAIKLGGLIHDNKIYNIILRP